MKKSKNSKVKSKNYKSKIKEPSKGLVITYYGNGKGKTTAALGLALRASGYKKKVLIIQFVKGDWTSGEEKAVENLKTVKLVKSGAGFVGILDDKKPIGIHQEAAQKGLSLAQKSLSNHEVIILDEILGAVKGGLVSQKDVLEIIDRKPQNSILVLTGRPKINPVLKKSDLITEMRCIKHPFDRDIMAIKGIDY